MPLSKVLVFTRHRSAIRRRGVASTIKNVCFATEGHAALLAKGEENNVLPYVMLPMMGQEEYGEEESEAMPEELQLLDPGHEREADGEILKIHLDTLLLLCSTRMGRDVLRGSGVYPVVRECHLAVEDEGVREACDRVVQMIMREEPKEGEDEGDDGGLQKEKNGPGIEQAQADEDEEIVDVV